MKTKLNRIVVAYPSGNTTALIFDELSQVNRSRLNTAILEAWQAKGINKPVEQCCAVTQPKRAGSIGRVEMLGGEFCGNATRSAVWLLAKGRDGRGFIEVSGCDKALSYEVKDGSVTLEMPLPEFWNTDRGLIVEFGGITQLVTHTKSPRVLLQKILAENWLDVGNKPAFGVSNYDADSQQAKFSVWVKNVNTVFDETACGSGTAAIGIAEAVRSRKTKTIKVRQPSGETIEVLAVIDANGKLKNIQISGRVDVLFDGNMELDI